MNTEKASSPRGAGRALALASIALGLWSSPAWGAVKTPASARTLTGVVSHVVDGDTVWLSAKRTLGTAGLKRSRVKVRLLGMDAPEMCQPGGPASRMALQQRLQGQMVRVALPASRSRDDYGRLLGRVYVGGDDVGQSMVRSGHAWSYAYRRSRGLYAAEQAEAMREKRGVFAKRQAENPRDFRRRHGECAH